MRVRVYRYPLAGRSRGEFLWLVRTVIHPLRKRLIDDSNQPGGVATLVEVFVVRLSEYELFVEPMQSWELN